MARPVDYFKRAPMQRVAGTCGRALPALKICCDRVGLGWLLIPLIAVIALIGIMVIGRRK